MDDLYGHIVASVVDLVQSYQKARNAAVPSDHAEVSACGGLSQRQEI